ncbi:MAG: Water stress and hypersensitive response domain-containing protein [Chromatiales bacterium]|jgi:LEA14-like dessication related protein|nr:MAG: Water stress and hypersensitive response domain-containing protein [Chromatiales bacterium]
MIRHIALLTLTSLVLGGCALLQPTDPLQVTVAGVEPLPGEGFELRMMLRLRVQNPNDTPIEYSGAYVNLEVQDKTFATGVSKESGTVAAFGESVISVPVTVSMLRMAGQFMGVLDGKPVDRIRYQMRGKLGRGSLRSLRFESQGEFMLPVSTPATNR